MASRAPRPLRREPVAARVGPSQQCHAGVVAHRWGSQNGRSSALAAPSVAGAVAPTSTGGWAGVGRPVAAGRAVSGGSRAALEQHLAGFEGDRFALGAVLVGPLAPVELGFDDHAGAPGQVLVAGACLRAVHLDGVVVGLVHPLLAVAPAGGRGDPQPGDLGARGQLLELDVAGQVPGQGGGGDVTHVLLLDRSV